MRIIRNSWISIAMLTAIMSCGKTECHKVYSAKQGDQISYRCSHNKKEKIDSTNGREDASLFGIGDPDVLLKFQ